MYDSTWMIVLKKYVNDKEIFLVRDLMISGLVLRVLLAKKDFRSPEQGMRPQKLEKDRIS